MKCIYIKIIIVLFALLLSGCAKPKIEIVIPPASSRELGIRSEQYDRTMARHSLEENRNNYDNHPPPADNGFSASDPAYPAPAEISNLPDNTFQSRIALVIGNANYIHGGRLSNPLNDAREMSRSLQKLGFKVIMHEDARQTDMKKAIDDFGKNIKGSDVSLFFYAGHGVQVKGNNYLIPVDADIDSENDIEYNCVHAGRILAKMEDAGCQTNVIILDACRDNPFERSWSRSVKGNGLAFMNAPSGSLIAYSTSPGNTASDGIAGKNGVYTSALLQHIETPNITIEELFKRVRVTVEERTNKKQIPWESTSLKGNFFFKVQKQSLGESH